MSRARKVSVLILIYDIIVSNLAYGAALLIRFDFRFDDIPQQYLDGWLIFVPFFTGLLILINMLFGVYRSIWRYVSYDEAYRTLTASFVLAILTMLGTNLFFTPMPRSYYLIGAILQFMAVLGARVTYRMARRFVNYHRNRNQKETLRTLIVGAGEAAVMIIREANVQEVRKTRIIGLVDDNPDKKGRRVEGLPILGTTQQISEIVERQNIECIVIAIPSLCARRMKEIIDICKTTKCIIKMVPHVSKLVMGEVKMSDVKEVRGTKVRLSLSRGKIINSFRNSFYYDSKLRNIIPTSEMANGKGAFCKEFFSINDVVYLDRRNNIIRFNGKTLNIEYEELENQFNGFIKYDSWEFEKEARVATFLKRESERNDPPEYIYAKINEELLKNFIITFDPWSSDEMKAYIKNSLNELAGMELTYQESVLCGEVALKW